MYLSAIENRPACEAASAPVVCVLTGAKIRSFKICRKKMWKNFYFSTLGSIIFPDFVISDIAKLAIIIAFWHKKGEEAHVQRFLLMLDVEWFRE